MKVKRYTGNTMQEAVLKIKSELGSEALILHSRKRKRRGFFGFLRPRMVEVIAAIEEEPEEFREDVIEVKEELADLKETITSLSGELSTSRSLNGLNLSSGVEEIIDLLSKQGFESELIRRVASLIVEDEGVPEKNCSIEGKLRRILKELIPTAEPIEEAFTDEKREHPHVVALVGPTGVGKTTTVAKLAACFTLFKDLDVALLTVDTYRIAAVEQLKTYSKIIEIPVEVAYEPEEIESALEEHRDRDLILVDTAGRSQNNQMHLSELKRYLDAIRPDEIHLVLSATTQANILRDIIEKFRTVSPEKTILTKVDESSFLGSALSTLISCRLGLAYYTNGQDVPDDLEIADPEKLLDYIFKENSHERSGP